VDETMRRQPFVLETPRLILRPLAEEDVGAIHRLYAEWDVAKSLSRIAHPFSVEAARRLIAEASAAFRQGSGYTLGMFERQGGAFVGVVSLRIPSADPALPGEERADDAGLGILGYSVARPRWGQGFASEGAKRVVEFALDDLGLDRLQASPLRENPASRRILERLGFAMVEAGIAEEPLYGGPPRLADRYLLTAQRRRRRAVVAHGGSTPVEPVGVLRLSVGPGRRRRHHHSGAPRPGDPPGPAQ